MRARRLALLGLPLLWLLLFVGGPLLLVLKISFAEARLGQPPFTPLFGPEGLALHLGNYALMLEDALYLRAFGNSLLYAGFGTLGALVIGLAVARAITCAAPRWQPLLLTLVILPFWTSFLIRVYAWILLLKPEGLLNGALLALGLIEQPLAILNTGWAVTIGITQAYLPFMILPVYASLSGQPRHLAEAAVDLGATPRRAFWLVTVPLARPGIIAGCLMVFIPAVGEFIIPDLLGGSATPMLGQALWTEFFLNRDWPMASALAVALTLLLLGPALWLQRQDARHPA